MIYCRYIDLWVEIVTMSTDKSNITEHDAHDEVDIDIMNQAACQEALEQAQKEAAEFKDKWMRSVAELDNTRKRAQKERDDALKYGMTKFAQDILAVADNMQRALEVCPLEAPSDMQGMIDGIKMTQSELGTILARHGIQEIQPLYAMFDPNQHQAMFEVPLSNVRAPENQEVKSGMVVQVLQCGYTIHDRLLRPAMVGVAKAD